MKKREATMVYGIGGEFATFAAGEKVFAWQSPDGVFGVERRLWKKPNVTLCNVLVGVPRDAIQFQALQGQQRRVRRRD